MIKEEGWAIVKAKGLLMWMPPNHGQAPADRAWFSRGESWIPYEQAIKATGHSEAARRHVHTADWDWLQGEFIYYCQESIWPFLESRPIIKIASFA